MQRPWRGAAYWLVPNGLLSLFSYRTQDHQPRSGPTHNGLGLPRQTLIKKMPHMPVFFFILKQDKIKYTRIKQKPSYCS